jgi:Cytochrome c554 and c-prime
MSRYSAILVALFVMVSGCGFTPGGTRLSSYPPPPGKTKFFSATQCATCHPVEYREWRTAMHSYAANSPVLVAFNAFIMKGSGGGLGVFCVRCHSTIGVSQGEGSILPNSQRTEVALQSVTCMTCHGAHTRDGQASGIFHNPIPGQPQPIIYGPFYGYDEKGAPNPSMRLIKSPHPSAYWGYLTQSRFCGTCHDVILPDGSRLEEAYSEWKNSPYAREGITCQKCHMSPVAGKDVPFDTGPIVDTDLFPDAPSRPRTSHLFTGPDYSILPHYGQEALGLSNAEFEKLTQQLRHNRETLFRNAATMDVHCPGSVKPGGELDLAVAVTNSGTGHNLPTGFAAERQVWLEVVLKDAGGHVLFVSGNFDKYGDLRDDDSRQVIDGTVPKDRDLFNLQAEFILQDFRGTQTEAPSTTNRLLNPVPFLIPAPTPSSITGYPLTGRIFKEGLPPFATRTADYDIAIPKDAKGPLALSVRLRFRNIPAHLLHVLNLDSHANQLQIVEMQGYKQQIAVSR